MSQPKTTKEVIADIELIQEALAQAKREIVAARQRIQERGLNDLAPEIAQSAAASGMDRSRANSYAGDFTGAIVQLAGQLEHLTEDIGAAGRIADGARHVVTVLPGRCPAKPDALELLT